MLTKSHCSGLFLSTPSARRATTPGSQTFPSRSISIHALCEEGDLTGPSLTSWTFYFYPRPLRGGRPNPEVCLLATKGFLSTPSARRATGRRPSYRP